MTTTLTARALTQGGPHRRRRGVHSGWTMTLGAVLALAGGLVPTRTVSHASDHARYVAEPTHSHGKPANSWPPAKGKRRPRPAMTDNRAPARHSRSQRARQPVVRSGTGCYGWPPPATLCPKPVPSSEITPNTPAPPGQMPRGTSCNGFIAKVRVAGSSPVVRSKALLRGQLPTAVDPGRASP
jgi:hypothetical protein